MVRVNLQQGKTALRNQAGMSMAEVLVAVVIMATMFGSIATLVGAAIRGKMISTLRSADTETARQTLEWMSERLRNAGLNIRPSLQAELRCRDMVVAQDAALRPQTDSVYVSGEIYNSDTTAGNQVITVGYRLAGGIVVQDSAPCSGGWSPTTAQVSNPVVTATALTFRYFQGNGAEVVVPTTDVDDIRDIRMILVTLTVQGVAGASGAQTQTFTRLIMLRNPRPDTSDWLPPQETNP
jgi:Tfp pilus assembly protein PilV